MNSKYILTTILIVILVHGESIYSAALRKEEDVSPEMSMMMAVMNSPELLDVLARQAAGEEIDQGEIFRLMMSNPTVAQPILEALVKSGSISFAGGTQLPASTADSSDKGFGGSQRGSSSHRKK